MIKVSIQKSPRISQGDIYKDVEFIEGITEIEGIIEISKIIFPRIIVLTQDCDLNYDSKFRFQTPDPEKHDKLLISVLVAPIYNVDHVYQGEHLSELGRIMSRIADMGKTRRTILENNKDPRYHYLEFPENVPIPASVIDFKHYFSVHVEYLNKIRESNFVCSISTLYREDVSQRFASFLSRIGLPELQQNEQ